MKRKLIGKEKHEPRCGYCEHGIIADDTDDVLCKRNGVVNENDSCRHFRYDPLKRKPTKIRLKTDFDPKDFEL